MPCDTEVLELQDIFCNKPQKELAVEVFIHLCLLLTSCALNTLVAQFRFSLSAKVEERIIDLSVGHFIGQTHSQPMPLQFFPWPFIDFQQQLTEYF